MTKMSAAATPITNRIASTTTPTATLATFRVKMPPDLVRATGTRGGVKNPAASRSPGIAPTVRGSPELLIGVSGLFGGGMTVRFDPPAGVVGPGACRYGGGPGGVSPRR